MRGEHQRPCVYRLAFVGSSPHARGTLHSLINRRQSIRIIPACAGNTNCRSACGNSSRDHPRMRGEHMCISEAFWADWGSSPHARGTHNRRITSCSPPRIIPACAGNTATPTFAFEAKRDHPRMRGEHSGNMSVVFLIVGSSPHARGTPSRSILLAGLIGIIPACAGNTRVIVIPSEPTRDHPRMRGEHTVFPFNRLGRWGSSPHARGTHLID